MQGGEVAAERNDFPQPRLLQAYALARIGTETIFAEITPTISCCFLFVPKTVVYIVLTRRSVSAALALASRGRKETCFPARVAHPRRVLEGVA